MTPWVARMLGAWNLASALGTLPRAGGLLDQDWEVVMAFCEIGNYIGGIGQALATRNTVRLG